jgi:hypothetical protein
MQVIFGGKRDFLAFGWCKSFKGICDGAAKFRKWFVLQPYAAGL